MEFYQVIILALIVYVIISIVFNILTSPITWIIIAGLVIYGYIKKKSYERQLDEYNKQRQKEFEEKQAAYRSGEAYRSGSEDIVDVNYVEKED